jgi:putative acetyltransferase
MTIRNEAEGDAGAIRAVVTEAFASARYSDGSEPQIVDTLREEGALVLSLVAEDAGDIIGHIAFSRVLIDGEDKGWFGLAPVSVLPKRQNGGVGKRLIETGLARLKAQGAKGCVVLGNPDYYGRFGFVADPRLVMQGVPASHFQAQAFSGEVPSGVVRYHRVFHAD